MTEHKIAPANIVHSLGQYGVKIANGKAYVSPEIMTVCGNLKIDSLEDFLSIALTLPSAIAFQLNWPLDRVIRANDAIRAALKGIVDDEIINLMPHQHD